MVRPRERPEGETMRRKFVLYVVVPLAALLIVTYFFIDRWVESGLESAGEAIVDARVEIDHLRLTLSPLAIEFQHMQVANPRDPWKNIVETGKIRFAMNFGQLLRGKFIVETMEVNDLIVGTKRTTDGSLPKTKKVEPPAPASVSSNTQAPAAPPSFSTQAAPALDRTVEKTPVFDIAQLRRGLNVDSLAKSADLQTIRHLDSLKQETLALSGQWQSITGEMNQSKTRLLEIETNIKAINPSELKSVDKITAAITPVDNAGKTVNEITRSVSARKDSITGQVGRISAAVELTGAIAANDLRRLMSMARLPNLNTLGIAEILLGPQVVKHAKTGLYWIDFARTNVSKYSAKPAMESPPRMKGQNIHFPEDRGYPKLWIQKILISGGTDKAQDPEYIYARGEVLNISSNQKTVGVPLTVSLAGTKGGTTSLSLDALFDRTKDTPLDRYRARVSGLPLADFQFGKSDFLPSKITNAKLASSLSVTIPGNQFDSDISAQFTDLAMQFPAEVRTVPERMVREVLESVKGFQVGIRLWNSGGGFDIALRTDLDEQFARRLREVVGAELAKLQNDLKAKVDERIADKRREFDAVYNPKRQEVEKQLQIYQDLVAEKMAFIDAKKKELTDRLGQEQKGTINDALKGLFKKK